MSHCSSNRPHCVFWWSYKKVWLSTGVRWLTEGFEVDLQMMFNIYPFFPSLCPLRGRQRNVATWWAASCARAKRSQTKNCKSCMRSLASRCFLCPKWATPWPPPSPAPPLCLTCWDLTGSTPGWRPTSRYRQYDYILAQCGYICNGWSHSRALLATQYLKLV